MTETTELRVGLITPVFPHPKPGHYVGIERLALELARHLESRKCRVEVFTTYWNGGTDGEYFEGVPLWRTGDASLLFGRYAALFDLHYLTWGRNLLKRLPQLSECDVLHSLAPLSSSEHLTARGLALVTQFHHHERIRTRREYLIKPFHYLLESKAYLHSTLVGTPSQASASDLRRAFGVPEERIRIIPYGVDLDRFRPGKGLPQEVPFLLTVGPHEARKGLTYLWRALRLLRDGGVRCRLVTVGRGPDTEKLERLAKTLGIREQIEFRGYISPMSDELPELYRRASLLVHPSLQEGLPMTLVEAMASGVPIVASETSGIPEAVGDAGLLVPPHSPEALARAIRHLLADSDLAATLSKEGRERAEASFGWDKIAQRAIEVYSEAIQVAQ